MTAGLGEESCTISTHPHAPWFNSELMKLRQLLVTGLHAAPRVGEQVSIKLTRTSLLGTEAEAPEPTTYFPASFPLETPVGG